MAVKLQATVVVSPQVKLQAAITRKAELETELEELTAEMKELVLSTGDTRVIVGEEVVGFKDMPGRASLKKEKLVALGVDTETIKAATVTGQPYSQFSVWKASKKDLEAKEAE